MAIETFLIVVCTVWLLKHWLPYFHWLKYGCGQKDHTHWYDVTTAAPLLIFLEIITGYSYGQAKGKET